MAFTGKPPDARRLAQQRWAEEYGWLFLVSPGGVTATDPYAGFLVYDTFTDDNDTALADHTPNKRPDTNAWTSLRGTWQVQGNQGKLTTTAGDGQNAVVIDAGTADVTATASLITALAGDTDSGLIVNAVDVDNYWLFTLQAAGACLLYEHTTGGFTVRGGAGTFTYSAGTTYAVKVVTNGDAIDCYVDDVLKVSYSVADRPHKTATEHGLRTFQTDTNSAFDNFTVA
jgi:hypothetical protein